MANHPSPQPPVPPRPVPGAQFNAQPQFEKERDNPGQSTNGTGGMGAPPRTPTSIDEPLPDPVALPPGSHGKDGVHESETGDAPVPGAEPGLHGRPVQ